MELPQDLKVDARADEVQVGEPLRPELREEPPGEDDVGAVGDARAREVVDRVPVDLRDEGLGHVEVLANDMYIDRNKEHAWCVSLRDGSPSGHDKAESMRRAKLQIKEAKAAAK